MCDENWEQERQLNWILKSVATDLALWPFESKSIDFPELPTVNIPTKFEHSRFICLKVNLGTNTQTHKHTDGADRNTHANLVGRG